MEWDAALPLVVTRDGRLITSGTVTGNNAKRGLYIWDLRSGRVLKSYPILADTISPDGRWAAWSEYENGSKIILFDLDAGKAALTLVPPFPTVMRVAFTPDGRRILATERDGSSMMLWDTANGAMVQKLAGDPSQVTTVAFSSDGKLLAAAGYAGYTIKVWDVGAAKLVQTFPREAAGTSAGTSGDVRLPATAPHP